MKPWMNQPTMTPLQYRRAIDKLGLTQAGAGRFFMVSERTARRWVAGDAEIPAAVAMMLRMMIEEEISEVPRA